jgi:hypothetical protein
MQHIFTCLLCFLSSVVDVGTRSIGMVEYLYPNMPLLTRLDMERCGLINSNSIINFVIESWIQVVLLVLEVHACVAQETHHFTNLVTHLLSNFKLNNSLLEKYIPSLFFPFLTFL